MTLRYEEAVDWIHSRLRLGIKPGLERMLYLLEQLGHPEQKNKWIHVAGTNGKGSTVSFMRTVLQDSGYEVGTFTSPYIESFNERISVNGVPISDESIVALVEKFQPIVEGMQDSPFGEPTEFEVVTAMFFEYFATMHPIDIGIVEVGLGGRLDCTNVFTPLLSVITTIGMDHIGILGDTLAKIASQKAGIIKRNVPVISGVTQLELQPLFQQWAAEQEAPYYASGADFKLTAVADDRFHFENRENRLADIEVGLVGAHQLRNAAVAIQALLLLPEHYSNITEATIRQGIARASWPGRFEKLSEAPVLIIDGAHNNEGIETFVQTMSTEFPTQKNYVLFSALTDKPIDQMINRLQTCFAENVILTTFDYPRALTAAELQVKSEKLNVQVEVEWQSTLLELINIAKAEAAVVSITGSLYFIAEVRAFLLKRIAATIK